MREQQAMCPFRGMLSKDPGGPSIEYHRDFTHSSTLALLASRRCSYTVASYYYGYSLCRAFPSYVCSLAFEGRGMIIDNFGNLVFWWVRNLSGFGMIMEFQAHATLN
jgi:hypothetical protein